MCESFDVFRRAAGALEDRERHEGEYLFEKQSLLLCGRAKLCAQRFLSLRSIFRAFSRADSVCFSRLNFDLHIVTFPMCVKL